MQQNAVTNQPTSLAAFIREIGLAEFSRRFGVHQRRAQNWLYGKRLPRPTSEITQRLIAETPLTWDAIYGSRRTDGQQ